MLTLQSSQWVDLKMALNPLLFRTRGDNVVVVFDVGMCLSNSLEDIRNAISSLVADGRVGGFEVDPSPPVVFQLGIEKSKSECCKYN